MPYDRSFSRRICIKLWRLGLRLSRSFRSVLYKTETNGCDFAPGSTDDEVKSQVIQGCQSGQLRKKALTKEMSLEDLIARGKAMELASNQSSHMSKGDVTENQEVLFNFLQVGPYKAPNYSENYSKEIENIQFYI